MNSTKIGQSQKASILIVEDEWIIALDIKQNLNKLGYPVVGIANNAATALDLVQEAKPNLILMDIYLQGGQSGIVTATEIHERFDLPIIFLTAHADEPTVQQALAANPYGYIVKPFEVHTLSTSVQIALANYRTEQAVKQALEHEKQLNALKTQFVSFVSHEFRNPLSSILITLELIERQDCKISQEKQKSYIRRAKTAVQDMSQLIQDVLIMSEIDREQFQCKPELLDIYHFCWAIVDDFQVRDQAHHHLQFSCESSENIEHPYYSLDPKLLQHILSNLLSNAIKYSPEASTVMIHLICQGDRVTITIQDQGIGISDADQASLFTPFHRGSNATRHPGTGLGLSIVKQCVEAHGGAIAVNSQIGKGTTFTVDFYAAMQMPCGLIENC